MDWGFIFWWLAVDLSAKGLLVKDGSGAVARDGFVGGLLAAVIACPDALSAAFNRSTACRAQALISISSAEPAGINFPPSMCEINASG